MKIGFIGLGIMGSRMARNLQKEGYQLVVYNRTKDKAAELLEHGAQWAEHPLQLANESELIITMLSTPEVVEEIAFGQQGFIAGMAADQIWINCSTINPSASRKLATAAHQASMSITSMHPLPELKVPLKQVNCCFWLVATKQTSKFANQYLTSWAKRPFTSEKMEKVLP